MYFLIIITFILLLLLILVELAFEVNAVVNFQLDTNHNVAAVEFSWLYPFINAKAEMVEGQPLLTVYLLKMRIIKRKIKPQKKARAHEQNLSMLDWMHALKLRHIQIDTQYGLTNPFTTGILCASFNILPMFLPENNVTLYQQPDFLPQNDYIIAESSARLNIGRSIWNLLKARIENKKTKRSDYHGTIEYN